MLDAAAGEFRVHGFADTSTEKLCEAAGVRRSSLYNAFTSKEELFVRALERYVNVTGGRHESILTDEKLSGAARLAGLLGLVIGEEREAAVRGHAAGCMAVATRMNPDLGVRDARVERILDGALQQQIALLSQALRAGRLDGTLRSDLPVREAALSVVALISGLRVMAQAGTRPEELDRIARLALGALVA
ncbi:TetR/AcrR family transcriptional regulator [Streptomyces sp. NBC_01260]|uniref:TetR/AcrR family transcriptional regulator n=1 Tax=unclassified Streptomyces TaxID=2593676 RepID=UPI0021A35DBF|nr:MULTISPECIES: TetR/AcrR family transcriptional regulator [unclassified Streptomyces]MCX4774967.1 TetR/AcrR family transcriptional regulator [Streptomyces sp. NBC_01285]